MGKSQSILADNDRQRLVGIVQEMEKNGESPDNISIAVEAFKSKYGVKKKDSTGEESVQPSRVSSPSQYPLPSKSEKENRNKFIAESDALTLIQEHENKSKKTTYDALVGNPLGNMRDYYNYSQSREGKVGKILSDVNSGKISVEDVNYLAQVAPRATRQVIKSVLPQKDNNKLLEPETINEFATEGAAILDKQATDQKVLSNSRNNDFVKQKVSSYGIDPRKLIDVEYAGIVSNDLDNKYKKELADLDKQYPAQRILQKSDFITEVRPDEYKKKKQEADERYMEIRNQIGTSAAYDYAKQNPTATPKEIGEQWYKLADPDGYKLWEKAGKKGAIDRDLAQVGINALYGTGNGGAIELAKADEKRADYQFPDKKRSEVLHRLGAELYKDQNWFFNTAPSIQQLDKASEQLPKEDRDFYKKVIREEQRKKIGTDIPMSGLVNKIGEGFSSTAIETWKGVGDLVGARSEKDQAIDAVNEGYDTKFQDVGTYAPAVSRLKEIKQKQRSGQPLSPQEIEEKQELETYTGVRSTAQEIIDGSGNLAGQVAFQALATKGLGGIAGAGVKAIGLAKAAPIVSGLATEETIAANALDFGISKAAINNITASGIAFASSYDAAKRDALRLMPDDKDAGKRTLYATIVGGLNAATERIFKDEKVLDAFNREVSPSIKSLVSKLSSGKIEREALGSAISDVLSKSKTFLKEAGESNLKESVEELATSAGTSVATAILAPAKFNAQQAFDDAVSTFTTTFLHGGLVAGMAGIHGYRANHLGTPLLAQIGVNERLTNDTKNFINGQILSGAMSQEEANAKFKVLNTAEKINRDVMPQVDKISRLPPKAREKYSIQLLNEKVLANNAESIEDPVLKSAVEAKIKESQDIRKGILKKDLFVDDNYSVKNLEEINAVESREITEREALAIDAIQKMDLSTTGLSAYAEVINDVKASPEEKKAALKGIYDQLTAEGTEAEVGQILGKDADLIYDLNYEKPQESEALSKTTKMPARNDDFVGNRDFFTEQEENEYYVLIDQGKEDEAKDMVLKRRQDVLTGAYKSTPTNKKEVESTDEGEEIIPQPEEDSITVEELMDKPVIRDGQRGTLIRDGQSVIFKPEKGNREYELGNVDEISKSSISDYGIEAEESVVTTDDTGKITVRGNKYINPFEERGQSPTDAILYDKEGNVVNVRMKTEDGKRRTFTGNVAEDLAYQITLKEINKNNETRERFESFINEDESARKEMADAGLSETSPQKTVEPDEKVQREKIIPKEGDATSKEKGKLAMEESNVEDVDKVEDSNISQPNEAANALEGSYDRLAKQMVAEGKNPLTDPEMKALAEQVKKLREGKTIEQSKKVTTREKRVKDLANELKKALGEKEIHKTSENYEGSLSDTSVLIEGDTVGSVLEKLKTEIPEYSELIKDIIKNADSESKKVKFDISKNNSDNNAFYNPRTDTITVSGDFQRLPKVIFHEIIHALTVKKVPPSIGIIDGEGDMYYSQLLEQKKRYQGTPISEIIEAYIQAVEAKGLNERIFGLGGMANDPEARWFFTEDRGRYGLYNIHEFLAEAFSSEKFRNFLNSVTSKNKSLWDKVIDAVGRFFGVKKDSLLRDVMEYGMQVISSNRDYKGYSDRVFYEKKGKEKSSKNFKGYVEDIGGLPGDKTGYNQDRKMRAISTGFIGEIKRDASISYKSAEDIANKVGAELNWDKESGEISALNDKSDIVMLARNWEYGGELSEGTKRAIDRAAKNGATFVLSDMTDVDTKFIDYLEEIGAPYTIYHAEGNKRIFSVHDNFYTNPSSPISFKEIGITENDTIEQAIDKAINYGGPFTEVFKAIKSDSNFSRIQLDALPSKGGNTSEGLYHPTGEGAITPYKLQIYNQGNTQYALVHELMHFFTLDSDAAQKVKDSKSSKALEGFYNYIVSNKGKPVTGLATVENYGLTNFKEFMAELLINPTFRNAVSDVYANNYEQIAKTDKFVRDQKGGSIIDIIRDLFRDLINAVIGNKSNIDFNPSESVVDQAAQLMTDLFFGGQDITSSQMPGQGGVIVGSVTSVESYANKIRDLLSKEGSHYFNIGDTKIRVSDHSANRNNNKDKNTLSFISERTEQRKSAYNSMTHEWVIQENGLTDTFEEIEDILRNEMGDFFGENSPLAIGGVSKSDIISDFVKKKIAEGIDEGIIREALEVAGIFPEESLKFIENAKPVEKRSFASEKEKERAVIAEVLSRNISAKEYPTIFENNKTQEQLAAKTQGEGQNREVNGAYVEALQDDLKQISLESARTLRDALGEDWGIKTLEYMEQNPSIGNLGQVIGLLNIISTEVYQDIRSTHDTDKLNRLKLIQNRIDIVSNQRAREASLGLRQRILYTKFANGEDMKDALANTILSPEQESLLSDLNEILAEPVTDEQLNKAAKPKATRNVKPKSSTGIFGKAKRKSSKSVKSELINQGVNAAKKLDEETGAIINKTFQDYIREANEKIKNIKC